MYNFGFNVISLKISNLEIQQGKQKLTFVVWLHKRSKKWRSVEQTELQGQRPWSTKSCPSTDMNKSYDQVKTN